MKKVLTILVFLCLILPIFSYSCQSQVLGEDIDLLKKRDFGKYFLSDIFSPNTEAGIGAGTLMSSYNINPNRRSTFAFFSESVIGLEIPLLTWNIFGNKDYKLALSTPISASILLDLNEPMTHPLINTDYRVGLLEINYLQQLDLGFIKNAGFKLIPYFHESSHIGDEVTIYRIQSGFPIIRVNASRNTAEMAITINDENDMQEINHSFKLGASMLYDKAQGYYWMRAEEGDTTLVTPSDQRIEWYGQYQWQGPSGIIKNSRLSTVFSVELRNRLRNNYPYFIYRPTSSQPPEGFNPKRKHYPSVNGYIGWRYRHRIDKPSYVGLYFRFYLGVNPHGQFRNLPAHRFYGVSFVYED